MFCPPKLAVKGYPKDLICKERASAGKVPVCPIDQDRIVKRFMQNAAKADHLPSKLPIRANEVNDATLRIIGKPVRATDAEIIANPRARSAIMRTAEKL